jgi:hypothetical protein
MSDNPSYLPPPMYEKVDDRHVFLVGIVGEDIPDEEYKNMIIVKLLSKDDDPVGVIQLHAYQKSHDMEEGARVLLNAGQALELSILLQDGARQLMSRSLSSDWRISTPES